MRIFTYECNVDEAREKVRSRGKERSHWKRSVLWKICFGIFKIKITTEKE